MRSLLPCLSLAVLLAGCAATSLSPTTSIAPGARQDSDTEIPGKPQAAPPIQVHYHYHYHYQMPGYGPPAYTHHIHYTSPYGPNPYGPSPYGGNPYAGHPNGGNPLAPVFHPQGGAGFDPYARDGTGEMIDEVDD